MSSARWKSGYNNHIHTFSHECLRNQIASFKHFWKLKKCLLNSKNSMEIIETLMVDLICVWKKR